MFKKGGTNFENNWKNAVQQKITVSYIVDAVINVLIVCGIVWFVYFVYGLLRGNDNTERTIQQIGQQQYAISNEIGNAEHNIRKAEIQVAKSKKRIGELQGRLNDIRTDIDIYEREIDNQRKIVAECLSLARENRTVLENIGSANLSGASQK